MPSLSLRTLVLLASSLGATAMACKAPSQPDPVADRAPPVLPEAGSPGALVSDASENTSEAGAGSQAPVSSPSSALISSRVPACRRAEDIARERFKMASDSPVPRISTGIDLDGDGQRDPILYSPSDVMREVVFFVEKQGCAQLVAVLPTNDPTSVKAFGRSKQGWASVHASTRFTFDESEYKIEHDGSRYLVFYREQVTEMVPGKGGLVRRAKPWSPWTLNNEHEPW